MYVSQAYIHYYYDHNSSCKIDVGIILQAPLLCVTIVASGVFARWFVRGGHEKQEGASERALKMCFCLFVRIYVQYV